MAKEFKGGSSKNARIKVDYQGVKPKVTFSYPDKKNQIEGSMFVYIFFFFLLVFAVYYMAFASGRDAVLQIYEPTELQRFVTCALNYSDQTLNNYSNVRYNLCSDKKSLIKNPLRIIFGENSPLWFLLILPFLFSLLIYLPFKKDWANFYPKFQAALARKKYVMFKAKDIKKDYNGDYFCEIPLFDNIILDYKATEDFSKYLKYFEIREHNFKYYKSGGIKSKSKKIKKKDKKKKKTKSPKGKKHYKKVQNEWLWYAKFYFSKKPKKGKLEVLFK